ncbi:MAG: selenium-dependent molybdenum cofactor biosynthesis protein YqeB [Bellilinea sp.]
MSLVVCIRGGGDLGSGTALRLHRAGILIVICELPAPLVVRRSVAFAEAIYSRIIEVEGVKGIKADSRPEIEEALAAGIIPVVPDPELSIMEWLKPDCVVDARLLKKPVEQILLDHPLLIGLGPGFTAGDNCHAVVETKRGPSLGRVYWQGTSEPDSGVPEMVMGYVEERVLRAPAAGVFLSTVKIGDLVTKGSILGEVSGKPIYAAFDGIIRGLIADRLRVGQGMKVGDLDPRLDQRLVDWVSDKSLAIGGGVLEAILSRTELRRKICG